MPIHAWSDVPAGLFHHFQQRWSGSICDGLNEGRLPEGYYALIEENATGLYPDVVTIGSHRDAAAPTEQVYAAKANRVVVRNATGRVVSVIEIVSPGNKSARSAIRSFVQRSLDLLRNGVSLLVVDLFPPTARDPHGLHPLIWDEIREEPFELPLDKPLTLAAYAVQDPITAYVETVGVGDPMPDMPAFVDPDTYVQVPLEAAYQETWSRCPRQFKEAVQVFSRT
jgi:hypothetical protein